MDAGELAQHALAWTIHRFKGYEDQSRLRQAVDEIIEEAPTAIISSEVFEVCTPGQVGELAKYFVHFDVEVILYARNAWGFVTMLQAQLSYMARSRTFGRSCCAKPPDAISRRGARLGESTLAHGTFTYASSTRFPDTRECSAIFWRSRAGPRRSRHRASRRSPNVGIDDASVRAVLLLNRIAQWTGRHAHDSPRVTRWKQRMRRRGRLGRAARVVDNVIPGTYWKLADRRWLTAKAQEWNDPALSLAMPRRRTGSFSSSDRDKLDRFAVAGGAIAWSSVIRQP